MTAPLSASAGFAQQPARSLEQHGTFEALLTPLLGTAYRAALHLTRDPGEAEDVVQEAALLAFKGFASFEPGTNFKAWFLRILTNAFLSRCRKARGTGTLSFDELPESLTDEAYADHVATRTANPGQICLSALATEQITSAIQALSIEYRTVATLYFVDDLSYEEMATILGCPIGTIRSRLHRARRMLQRALRQLAQDYGIRGLKEGENNDRDH